VLKLTIVLFDNTLYAENIQKTPKKRGWDINQLEVRKSALNSQWRDIHQRPRLAHKRRWKSMRKATQNKEVDLKKQ